MSNISLEHGLLLASEYRLSLWVTNARFATNATTLALVKLRFSWACGEPMRKKQRVERERERESKALE